MSEVIRIKELTKSYSKFTLGPLNVQFESGTAVAIIGQNGSGKSTLFRLIMNVLKPDAGTIEIFNQCLNDNDTKIKQQIGFVGDRLAPYGDMKIYQLASFISHWYPNWNQKRYENLLHRYQIDEQMVFNECSNGVKKKVEFVLALSYEPKLLLLDELSSSVDLLSQGKMREDLNFYMEEEENSIIMATHNLDDIKLVCDYICLIDRGNVVRFIEKDELQNNWARIWINHLPVEISQHPSILHIEAVPLQIVTDNFKQIEKELNEQSVVISHTQKLRMDEALEFIMTK